MKISNLEHLEVISEPTTIEGGFTTSATGTASISFTGPFAIGTLVGFVSNFTGAGVSGPTDAFPFGTAGAGSVVSGSMSYEA